MRAFTGRGLPCRPCHHGRGGLLPHRFTLATPRLAATEFGGLFSVALSLGSRPVAVDHRPALWCPDFPRLPRRGPRPPAPLQRGGSYHPRPVPPGAAQTASRIDDLVTSAMPRIVEVTRDMEFA